MDSPALHQRSRAFVTAFERGSAPPESFEALACDLARFQASHNPGYRRLCEARGVRLESLTRAIDAPAVPTDVFKLSRVSTFAENETVARFRTSGTTEGSASRGEHAFRTTQTYDLGALAFGRHWLFRDLEQRVPFVVLGPSPEELGDSSLMHMIGAFAERFASECTFAIQKGELRMDLLTKELTRHREGGPVAVLGTSFAFVHMLDELGPHSLPLPPNSRVMQTGGFKGKSREVEKEELVGLLARAFALSPTRIVSEYGMTELSSQFYEQTLFSDAPSGVYAEPPWARIVPVDPETLLPLPLGDVGIARIEDLANVDSAFAVLTQDRVRRVPGGFQLLGRSPGAPARGCSIAIDEMLGA